MTSLKCPHCRLNNFPGTLECRRCNRSLIGIPALALPAPYLPAATAALPGVQEKRLAPPVILLVLLIVAIMAGVGGVYGKTKGDVLKSYSYIIEIGTLALYLIGLAFVICGLSKRPQNELDRAWNARPSRLDGFLVIPATAVVLNVILRTLALNEGVQAYSKLQPLTVFRKDRFEQLDFSGLVMAEMIAHGLIILCSLILLGDYYKKRERLPALIVLLFGAEVLWGLVDITLGATMLADAKLVTRTGLKPLTELMAEQQNGSMGWLYLLIFLTNRTVNVVYFLKSKRVSATFAPADHHF